MKTLRKRDMRIPRRPLLWMAVALLFTLPPMFGTLLPWVPALLLLTIIAKLWMEPRGYRLRFTALKMALAGIAAVSVFISYGALKGIEPGVSLIVVLMAMKILEAHTAREFHFMIMLGWVLCLCGFFLEQDFATALCLLLGFALLLSALIVFYRGSGAGLVWAPLASAGTLLAQALPLIVLLFLFFPRVSAGFRILLTPSSSSAAGFSNRLSPGSVASLANSTEVAFRAEFPDGTIPPPDALYWRGLVMSQGDGMEWHASEASVTTSRASSPPKLVPVRQWITIEPHGARWMFALDWPVQAPPGALLAPGNYLWSYQTITKPRRYEVSSYPMLARGELQPRERKQMLDVPGSINPAVRELAQSWTDSDPRQTVRHGLEFFRTQGFRYSLLPGEYKKNDLEEFLFRRRIGFCEHYAASFATLMRLAGVPARVVVGYLGGEFNAMGRFFLVRQSDTHAWCEVWLRENGWTRVDPTSAVAPERVSLGFDSFLERSAKAGAGRQYAFTRAFSRQPVFAKIRLAWQTLNYAWDTRVLSFDAEAQRALAGNIGFSNLRPLSLLIWTVGMTGAVVATIAVWMQFRARTRTDELRKLYARFCRKAARLGIERAPVEGPLDFSRRAAQSLPAESQRIARIFNHYVDLRYAGRTDASKLQQLAKEVDLFGSRRAHHSQGGS